MQILEEYVVAELEIARQLQQNEADRQATGRQSVETMELPDNPLEEVAVVATSAPPIVEPTTEGRPDFAPIPVPLTHNNNCATTIRALASNNNGTFAPTKPHGLTNDDTSGGANPLNPFTRTRLHEPWKQSARPFSGYHTDHQPHPT